MPTPHNAAPRGAFAQTVLMPGDPLRAQWIAETYLTDRQLVNNVRGVQGYTGKYRGVPISVMASGMGGPSMGIYSHELFRMYDVEHIIRIGSAGAIHKRLKLRNVVAAQAVCTDSAYARQYGLPGTFAPIADFRLLAQAVRIAKEKGMEMPVGNLLSSDVFYDASGGTSRWAQMGVLAVEMETNALYCNAAYLGRSALTLCSISDHLVTGEALSPEERQNTFHAMIEIALDTARAIYEKE